MSGDLSILNPENLLTAVLAPSELGLGILNLISKAENIAKLADFSLSEKAETINWSRYWIRQPLHRAYAINFRFSSGRKQPTGN